MDAAPENLAAKTVVTESVAPTNVAKNAAPVPFVRFVAAESIASVNVPPKSDEAISLAAKTDDPKDAVPKILSAKSIEPRTVATRSVATRTKSVNSIVTETAEKKVLTKSLNHVRNKKLQKRVGIMRFAWQQHVLSLLRLRPSIGFSVMSVQSGFITSKIFHHVHT
jgi:hypothetical protein